MPPGQSRHAQKPRSYTRARYVSMHDWHYLLFRATRMFLIKFAPRAAEFLATTVLRGLLVYLVLANSTETLLSKLGKQLLAMIAK